ncbi:Terminal deoxynucleotidyl transferase, putative [Penicillium digitatum PHI26]|uniref:Terminal deoxynucleotidyl transferase, putative n=2 Tax=Penicillium digitatum TaxID=36651 RepID=K9GK42_PEND2|nr:Terminal deoxynucleotidyl transferase, putative [Penicillium digitatum Pd1]EKV05260.1 Terminal deoxynucleotidyl transferase, putative [Penicillium digitatum Pd1]EKV13586.1 Terminal deoxynucleotidyl transferase, putative [Penicillium digitatum PHI26]
MIAGQSSLSKDKTEHVTIFSSQPPIFILPVHLSLEELDEIEGRLIDHGGRLTYDIVEAGLVLGKVGRAKRAALELRTRGVWTEELIPSSASKSAGDGIGPPPKRRRRNQYDETKDFPVEIIDLSTESEGEDRVTHRHDPSNHLISEKKGQELQNFVTVLKLEWMNTSIKSGKCVSQDPFVVYLGRKIPPPPPTTKAENKQDLLQKSNQIIQRVNHDASLPTPRAPPPDHIYARRSKEPPGGSSQRPRPSLYRQTTSEYEEEETDAHPQPDWVRDQVVFACLRSAPLHSPNEDFISQLVKIRQIRKLTLDEIGVRAYSTSIASLAAYPHPIQRPSEILALPGCNAKIAELFSQFQQHGGCNHTDDDGNVATADALETDPALCVLNSFYQIWGVGAKTAREFYQRGWRDLDDIVEHGWSTLSRVQQIGVKFYEEFQQGVPRAESEGIATVIRDHAGRVRPEAGGGCGIECVIVGGYRRGKGLSGDVDVVLSHRDDAVTRNLVVDVVASLEAERCITHTLSLHLTSSLREQQTLPFDGDDTRKFDTLDKALVVWQDPHFDPTIPGHDGHQGGNPNIHRRVDIIISPWRTIGCAVLGWSGDLTFQRDLRRYAKKARSLKFDSSGVRDRSTGRQIDLEHDGETWEEREKLVMEGLGVGWRPPEERCSR